jgi:hypothetical protein
MGTPVSSFKKASLPRPEESTADLSATAKETLFPSFSAKREMVPALQFSEEKIRLMSRVLISA